jgi:hypothetical protein
MGWGSKPGTNPDRFLLLKWLNNNFCHRWTQMNTDKNQKCYNKPSPSAFICVHLWPKDNITDKTIELPADLLSEG